ncbi:MAG TPA: prolyl oligopeptidase family serine peptidase [Thermomicrobiales bacterium]|nr:prolyl oligopeptidase family serine peptidase [Thermomicrobiales bacterium]
MVGQRARRCGAGIPSRSRSSRAVYGRRYADLLHGAWREGDVFDTIAESGVLRERGLVDERRLAAWGGSAAGTGAHGAMKTRPATFAAAIV